MKLVGLSCENQFTMTDQIRINRSLKRLMSEKQMTFKRLAELSGVPESTIKTWSSGVQPRSMVAARKVARVLGISLEELVFGDDPAPSPLAGDPSVLSFDGWCKITIELPPTPPTPLEKIKKS